MLLKAGSTRYMKTGNLWVITFSKKSRSTGQALAISLRRDAATPSVSCVDLIKHGGKSWSVSTSSICLRTKTRCSKKLEIQVKRLRRASCEETGMSAGRVFANKNEGYLAIDFIPVAKVQVSQHADPILYWNQTVAEAHGVDRAAVQTTLAALSRKQNVEWTL